MPKALLSALLLVAACGGSSDDDDDGTPTTCEPLADAPSGSQVWSAAPDGSCMQAASKHVTGTFLAAQFVPGGGARFRVVANGTSTYVQAALNGDDPTVVTSGVLSPDGRLVVSAGEDEHNGVDARVSKADGTDEHVVTNLDFADRVDGILWAPSSDKVMINLENTSSSTGDGPMLFDASLTTIRSYVGQFYEGYARWSPDGTRLVIDGSTSDAPGLWIIPSDRGDATHLTTGNDSGGVWLDDDHVVAVRNTTASFDGPYQIVTVDAGTGVATPVATLPDLGLTTVRAVAPDGKTVAVWRSRTATTMAQLYFIELASGAITPIGAAGITGWFGEFSPDNAYFVASAAPSNEPSHLYRVDRDGTNVTQLTSGSSAVFYAWSADSSRVLWTGAALDAPR